MGLIILGNQSKDSQKTMHTHPILESLRTYAYILEYAVSVTAGVTAGVASRGVIREG